MAHLELFVFTWGLYPRRILIYLHEKGLLNSPHIKVAQVTISPTAEMIAPGKPKGTVPILALPDGTFIKQSVAILDYFEDICDNPEEDWQKDIAAVAKTSMRGRNARDRATTREILALADEATSMFGFACHKGSKLFLEMELTNPVASSMAIVRRSMKLLEPYYEGRFEGDSSEAEKVTIADCVFFSFLQFSKELYGVDLVADSELRNLRRFYDAFKERDSAKIPEDFYPRYIKELAPVWLE
ncbi:uncharacterized protein F4817DRAFT_329123 [Daldinia loculata]|uniref:uncharacterized protein n=1 Tax=Daldinia loculata TaxID=103429 RepID=UPI0020C22022|nr:uncharacterized protein F4817DRAFT_329123 [Daldinia loculata]KAI1649919.1 hypothetical protein F4817DRAFT_329123 [Daldinia loculata]